MLRGALPVGKAVDEFRDALLTRLNKTLNLNLWRHVRSGQLHLDIVRREVYTTRQGEERFRLINDQQVYANLQGYRLLDPGLKSFGVRLSKAIDALASINFADPQVVLGKLEGEQRTQIAKKLGRSMDTARRALEELADVRQFVGPIAVPTLRNWTANDACPIRIYFDRSGDSFHVGLRPEEKMRIAVSPDMEDLIGTLPHLGKTEF